MAAYTLTVRRRGATARERFPSLPEALAALEARLDELTPGERRGRERALSREIAAVDQVALRGEVAGPGVRGGVDVRGDGSAEAFTGRWRRVLVEREAGETATTHCAARSAPRAAGQLAPGWRPSWRSPLMSSRQAQCHALASARARSGSVSRRSRRQ